MLAAFAIVFLFVGGMAYAEDKAPPAQSHEEHHPEGEAKTAPKDSGMMGSMKMDDMMGMMHECMDKHKDGKMCDHEAMQKCEAKMKKGECQKMMKQVKTKEKAAK
jgi:hypothetical protein